MPYYEFVCAGCGPFLEFQKMSERKPAAVCPACHSLASKEFPSVNLRSMSPANRQAWARNERSAHEPHVCSSGCSHGPRPKAATPRKDGKPAFQKSLRPNRRPWMLGH